MMREIRVSIRKQVLSAFVKNNFIRLICDVDGVGSSNLLPLAAGLHGGNGALRATSGDQFDANNVEGILSSIQRPGDLDLFTFVLLDPVLVIELIGVGP